MTYSAIDPVTSKIYVRGNNKWANFSSWDPQTEKWTTHIKSLYHRTDYRKTGVIDPLGRRFHAFGYKGFYSFDFKKRDKMKQEILKSKGPQEIVNKYCPGLQYDPVLDKIVGWATGPNLYLLDPVTLTWEKKETSKENKVLPSKHCHTGTYGRFRYIPDYNVYILVNSTSTNVFFYKLSNRKTAPIPDRLKNLFLTTDDKNLFIYTIKEITKWPTEEFTPLLIKGKTKQKENPEFLKIIQKKLASFKKNDN